MCLFALMLSCKSGRALLLHHLALKLHVLAIQIDDRGWRTLFTELVCALARVEPRVRARNWSVTDIAALLKGGVSLRGLPPIGRQGMPPAYPPLAGNPSIEMESSVNSLRMVLNGGYPPQTSQNPRPYGMPPFGQVLSDDVAAVVTYI